MYAESPELLVTLSAAPSRLRSRLSGALWVKMTVSPLDIAVRRSTGSSGMVLPRVLSFALVMSLLVSAMLLVDQLVLPPLPLARKVPEYHTTSYLD